jgi:tRNA nucleotidyltransferase (CCA-adding enzyme)
MLLPVKHKRALDALNHYTDFEFRFVGGCVRDMFLGREVKDWDIVTDAPPKYLESIGMKSVGKSFPVYLFEFGDTTYEVACCRTEKKVGTGHQAFECEVVSDFGLDAQRRDLTVNTMWYGKDGLKVFDPVVMEHALHGVLEAVTDAFAEDPLRVFRVARFHAQLGDRWVLGPKVKKLMYDLRDELKTLSSDRVRIELEKALMGVKPSLFFQDLRDTGCLGYWFPEVAAMTGVDHSSKPPKVDWHPEGDVWNHLMLVLDKAQSLSASLDEMYGALGHDFGKPLVPREQWPSMARHEMLADVPVTDFCARLGLGHQVEHLMKTVAYNHTKIHTARDLRDVTMVRTILTVKRTVMGLEGMVKVCQADAQGRAFPFCDEPYPQAQFVLDQAAKMAAVKFDGVPNMTREKAESMYVRALKG